MMRQSEFKRKYDPDTGKYVKKHIYGEGIMDSVKSFFRKPIPKKPPPPKPTRKKVTFDSNPKEKKAGDKIVKLLSRENPPSTKKPPPPKPTRKKVTFDSNPKEKKAGDKIVKLLSRENPTTKTKHKMTEKEYNQYLENLRKLYNY